MHKDSTQILGFECGGVPLGIHYGKTEVAGVKLDYNPFYNGIYHSNPGYFLWTGDFYYRVIYRDSNDEPF